MRRIVKTALNWLFVVLALPAALLAGFGRFKIGFDLFAHLFAAAPGIIGVFVRRAYYFLTLESCSLECVIAFGTFFSHRKAAVDRGVCIGAYCVIGQAHIGRNTQIACGVHVLSGAHQHRRDERGNILDCESGTLESIAIGADSWIGTSAVIMADVGEAATIGAGSVVTKPVPPGVVAVGAPARPIEST